MGHLAPVWFSTGTIGAEIIGLVTGYIIPSASSLFNSTLTRVFVEKVKPCLPTYNPSKDGNSQ